MFLFNGQNKTITIDSGVTSFDVIQMYSEWKRWVAEFSNSKWALAFQTVGGDQLTSSLNAGTYFFLRNDLGWRIRPPEENCTIYLVGNLTPQDISLPIITPTIGGYSVLILGLQPVTQSASQLLTLQQQSLVAQARSEKKLDDLTAISL